jgi:hypothetical protein
MVLVMGVSVDAAAAATIALSCEHTQGDYIPSLKAANLVFVHHELAIGYSLCIFVTLLQVLFVMLDILT